ncbi:MAG: FAD-dependent oxidoreductase [Pseudomonadota bacterium]
MSGIIVVGGGQAGASLVARLRSTGYSGPLTLVAEEPVPPYQRPPLSKGYLLDEMTEERLYLRPAEYYAANDIDLRLGTRASSIDPALKTLKLGHDVISYDQLALTTGSRARYPSEEPRPGIYTVRTLADVDAMAPEFLSGRRLLVIGGGYIGLEAAAVAVKKGLSVTIVETADRILSRVACPRTSDYFRSLHRSHGVNLREGMPRGTLFGKDRVEGLRLPDGEEISADFVIAGIGIEPAAELAEAAGLQIENGISVNQYGQTSDPSIWAAGDCASFPYRGRRIRLESVQNAIDQAELVADNMRSQTKTPYLPQPWFWSDQYDVKLQIAGLASGYDRSVLRIGTKPGSQSVWYFRGTELLAVDAMNDPRAYMVGKRMIQEGTSPDAALVGDPETDLKALLAA